MNTYVLYLRISFDSDPGQAQEARKLLESGMAAPKILHRKFICSGSESGQAAKSSFAFRPPARPPTRSRVFVLSITYSEAISL